MDHTLPTPLPLSISLTRRGVAINAAFLQEIKEDNVRLYGLLARIEELVDTAPPGRVQWEHLAGAVRDLRDQLAVHFSLEESFGYMDDALEVAPRLSDVAATLLREHELLSLQIRNLADSLPAVAPVCEQRLEQLCGSVESFCVQLRRHERQECALILSAFGDDIGVGD